MDTFETFPEQEEAKGLLRAALAEGPAHAYLFHGPRGVGKRRAALAFAGALLGDPGRVSRRAHPDLYVLAPLGEMIRIDDIRALRHDLHMRPFEADRRVYLVLDAQRMNEDAQAALLKTLEEPTTSVVFLLVAESEDDFPATVASRCRTIHMGRVPQETMVAALEARGLDHAGAEGVAVVSGGRPGLALALMDRPEVSRFRDLWLAIPGQVTPHPGDGQRLASDVLSEIAPLVDQSVSEDMTKEREQRARRRAEQSLLVNGLEILASWYTDSASLQMGGPVRNTDLPLGPFTDVSPRKAVASAEKILDAVVDIQANLRRELVLANLFAGLGSET